MRPAAGLALAALMLAACSTQAAEGTAPPPEVAAPTGLPALDVEVVADGLEHPWDVVQAPDGTLLLTERPGGFTAVLPDGDVTRVDADLDDLLARGETGLMGLALDPAFESNRRLYSCQGSAAGDIRVIGWTVATDWSSLTRFADPLVAGLPLNGGGRHGGCRLEFATDGALLVGAGDSADGAVPQDPGSLGGKVLRVEVATGDVEVWTLGHRNVQGLALRPGSEQVFSVEHGPDRDDEVNLLRNGANFGWDPDGDGSYDESVPMTAPGIPGAVEAVWSSGTPTLATSGATFVSGEEWADYDGLLLVALLKAQGVLALRLDDAGEVIEQYRLPVLDGTSGRIRTVQQGRDGALYALTDNGSDDALLRITPRS